MVFDLRYAMDDDDVAAGLQMAGSPERFTVLAAHPAEGGVLAAITGSVDIGRNATIGMAGSGCFAAGAQMLSGTAFLRWTF